MFNMTIDYGTILVKLHPGLSFDQKMSMLFMTLDNQLHTENRNHKNTITQVCTTLLQTVDDGVPFGFVSHGSFYRYTFVIVYEKIFTDTC